MTTIIPYQSINKYKDNALKTPQVNNYYISILSDFVIDKSYVILIHSTFEHITSCKLSDSEKLYYLLTDSLALINKNSGKQRSIALSSDQWAAKLGCSRSKVFAMQNSLEQKGYFVVLKKQNKYGQNNRNVIIPTLPDKVFNDLKTNTKNKIGQHLPYDELNECKISYLDRTKMFIPINYRLLSRIINCNQLTSFQKILWLDFFVKSYVAGKKNKSESFSCIVSYKELSTKYNCSVSLLSKSIKTLSQLELIDAKRVFVKRPDDLNDDLEAEIIEALKSHNPLNKGTRQDKSLWQITISFLAKNENNFNSKNSAKNDNQFSSCDPHFDNSRPLLNKKYKSNICNIRSTQNSDFFQKNSLFVKTEDKSNFKNKFFGFSSVNQNSITSHLSKKLTKALTLDKFYPLNTNDWLFLQKSSGREFSLNAMNEILLDMSKRLPNREFKSKKAFLSYMAKAFTYEKRDVVKTGNKDFKIKANHIANQEKERFLTKIENRSDSSQEAHFCKKLAAVFEPEKAFALLKSYDSIHLRNGIFSLYLRRNVELTAQDREVILQQARATHERLALSDERLGFIETLEIKQKSHYKQKESSSSEYKPQSIGNRSNSQLSQKKQYQFAENIWGRAQKQLLAYYGETLYKHWFAPLEANIDDTAKTIVLGTPSRFIIDWVRTNYLDFIVTLIAHQGYKLTEFGGTKLYHKVFN